MSIAVTLKSSTVFWVSDLGLTQKDMERLRSDNRLGTRVAGAVEEWLSREMKGTWRLHADGVWFMEERDAVLFKLFWSGSVKELME